MRQAKNIASASVLLVVVLLFSLIPSTSVKPVAAHPGLLIWSFVDTPNPDNNVIASPSEVNVIAIGSDTTFYAVDIPNSKVYGSTDGGVTWTATVGTNIAAAANLPVWNLAVAPDDVRFLVAVTDGGVGDPGPRQVFASDDGGATWRNTNIPLVVGGGEYISCIDISVTYGANNRDVAVGTRTVVPPAPGLGRVYVLKYPGMGGNWNPQDVTGTPQSTGWVSGDVVAVKFSPAYPSDSSLAVISCAAGAPDYTRLQLGSRDVDANTTLWNAVGGYPVLILDTNYPPVISPTETQIITADLELPSDFSGTNPSFRRFYLSTDAIPGVQSGVYRVDNNITYRINPPITATSRISSIAYLGTYAEGVLLAGEVTAAVLSPSPSSQGARIWRTADPMATVGTPTWLNSDARKSPTGGAVGSGFANAQVAWNSGGSMAYCGTSSACLGVFNLPDGAVVCPEWPDGYLNGAALDESAFSVSPYAPAYEQLLDDFGKVQDAAVGNVWNQLSLIDTQMGKLSDVAVLEVPGVTEETATAHDYDILYLASINPGGYDSIWRSTSDLLGRTWERVLCLASTNDDIILRVKQTSYDETDRSEFIFFADLGTDAVGYSADEGQVWNVSPFATVTDLAVASDSLIYILSDTLVYRYTRLGASWTQTHREGTQLGSGHTIAVPLENPEGEDWVIVGEQGPPNGLARVAWADFSQLIAGFKPPLDRWIEVPVVGNVHVIADDRFEVSKTIYAASHNPTGTSGKIYRWVIGESIEWEELEPPNSAFYGLAQRNDVLYGAWSNAEVPEIITDTAGDRTLYPRANVLPPIEWDYLTAGLPIGVVFTREPTSLKISSNEYNMLWAIDDRPYDWISKAGCLWEYTDTLAKVGPWTTSPASGDFISVDPVSGRANEVNFRWRQLSYASRYELQLAKDSDFSIVVLGSDNITPVGPLAPECYFPAGGLAPMQASGLANWGNLETGHAYYWRVRARAATTGEVIRSPWSATMYFTVGTGLPVMSKYPTITLFSPNYGARDVSRNPGFSWSPMPKTSGYEFILAKDAALQQVIVKTKVPLTSYMHDEKLDFGASYFWQVRAIEPVVSDPSPIGTFTVVAMAKPAGPAEAKPSPIPFWVWGVIAVCTALVAVIIAFATVKPGSFRPRAASVAKLELIDGKPQNPIAKLWNAITMGIRRRRYLRRGGGGLDDL